MPFQAGPLCPVSRLLIQPQPKAANTHNALCMSSKAAHMMLCIGSSVWPGNAPHRKSRRGATRVCRSRPARSAPSPVSSYSHRQLTHMMLCMGSSGLQQQQKNMHCIGTPQQSPEEELHACAVQGRPALLPVSRLRLYQQPSVWLVVMSWWFFEVLDGTETF